MKKAIATLFASAAFIGFAYAGETEGVVAAVDPDSRTIMLEDGATFLIPEEIDIAALAPGASVRIAYEDGTMTATTVDAL